ILLGRSPLGHQCLLWPFALDICKDCTHFVFREESFIGRHVAEIVLWSHNTGLHTFPHDVHEDCVRVVPCMSRHIVRRCWQPTIGPTLPPVKLTLELCPMTDSATLVVYALSQIDQCSITWIDIVRARGCEDSIGHK